MAPVVCALAAYEPEVETKVALTGQHTSLVDQALQIFDLAPDFDLGIMREGQTLYDVTHGALDGLRSVVDILAGTSYPSGPVGHRNAEAGRS